MKFAYDLESKKADNLNDDFYPNDDYFQPFNFLSLIFHTLLSLAILCKFMLKFF